jgi:outer membrane protein TolC
VIADFPAAAGRLPIERSVENRPPAVDSSREEKQVMRTLFEVFLATCIGAGGLLAQQAQPPAQQPQQFATRPAVVHFASPGLFGSFVKPYLAPSLPEFSLANSPRVRELIKDGKMQLSLDDAIALALENNLNVVAASYDPAVAQTDLLRAKAGGATRGVEGSFQSTALFAGAIGGGLSGGGATGGGGAGGSGGGGGAFSVAGGSFDPSSFFSCGWSQSTVPLGISILQGVSVLTQHAASCTYWFGQAFSTGTSIGAAFFGERYSSSGITSIFNPQVPTQMAISISQPLLNGFGRRVNLRFVRIAQNDLQVADSTFRQKVMTAVGKVLGLYWDLTAAHQHVLVAQQALELAQKTLNDTSQEVKLGVIAHFEEIRASAEVARQREALVRARADSEQFQEQIKTTIAKQVDTELATAEIVPVGELPEPTPEDIPTLAQALEEAAKSRPELEQANLNLRNQEIAIKAAHNALLPSLGVFATYSPQGLAGDLVTRDSKGNIVSITPSGFGDAVSQTLRNVYPYYAAGFSLSIPLRNRSAKADLARAYIEQRQREAILLLQKNTVAEEVRRAVTAATEAKAEIEAARASVTMAKQTLDGEQKKFQLGESDVFKLGLAQRDLAAAEDAEVTARANYAKALVQYAQATGTVLAKYHIEIAAAEQGPTRGQGTGYKELGKGGSGE